MHCIVKIKIHSFFLSKQNPLKRPLFKDVSIWQARSWPYFTGFYTIVVHRSSLLKRSWMNTVKRTHFICLTVHPPFLLGFMFPEVSRKSLLRVLHTENIPTCGEWRSSYSPFVRQVFIIHYFINFFIYQFTISFVPKNNLTWLAIKEISVEIGTNGSLLLKSHTNILCQTWKKAGGGSGGKKGRKEEI